MNTLKKDVNKSMFTELSRYMKEFDENIRALPAFKAGQFVNVNTQSGAVLASDTGKVTTASYKKLVFPVLGL